MEREQKRRYLVWLLLVYSVPLFFFLYYVSFDKSFFNLSFALLIIFLGTALLYVLLPDKERDLFDSGDKNPSALLAPKFQIQFSEGTNYSMEQKVLELIGEVNRKEELLSSAKREGQEHLDEHERLQQDYAEYRRRTLQESERAVVLFKEYHSTMDKQRFDIEKQKEEIALQKERIKHLKDEMKALLDLTEFQKAKLLQIQNNGKKGERLAKPECVLLKRVVDMAQKFSGVESLSKRSGLVPKFSSEHYALDKRRFFDSLSSESGGIIFVYAQRDKEAIYVSPSIENDIKLSQKKFLMQFNQIMQEQSGWQVELDQLPIKRVSQFICRFPVVEGSTKEYDCHIALIPTGVFRGHVIGVLKTQVVSKA